MEDMASQVSGIDQFRRPYLPERTVHDLPELDLEHHGSSHTPSSTQSSFTDELYRSYLSVAADSRDDGSKKSRTGTGTNKYEVVFEGGETTTLRDYHPVVVSSDDHLVSEGEYVLRSLSRVGAGDEIVYINRETQADLWEQFLRENWEETNGEVDAEAAFIDAVRLWMESVRCGLEEHSNTGEVSDGVSGFASEVAPHVSVDRDAVLGWARSVCQADSASELVFRKDLRTGPQQADGVQIVAKLYGDERMVENWEQVHIRIKSIRAALRQRGSSFWGWIAARACDGELFNQSGVGKVTVQRCRIKE